jgi:hypothetical protein
MICSKCGAEVKTYRQCPYVFEDGACGLNVGFCSEHGGDAAAVDAMVLHLRKHREASA